MKLLEHCLVLLTSFILVFAWQQTPLSAINVQLLAIFIVLYLFISLRNRGKGFLTMGGNPFGIFLLSSIILLVIFSTGNISSSVFFLLYFLSFGIAFVFEPASVFIFILGAFLVFVPSLSQGDFTVNLLKLLSLVLIGPLAYFFGKEYRLRDQEEEKIEELEERTQEAADTIAKDIDRVIKEEKQNLRPEDMEKLNEVLEETEDLRRESSNNL